MAKVDKDGNVVPLQQANTNKVPARKWRSWPDICQRVFNETYETLLHNQTLFLHPKTPWLFQEHWQTTAWNASWVAADACQHALKGIVKGKGYLKK